MITQETLELMWGAYREIIAGEKLLKDMAEIREAYRLDRSDKTLKDAFGHRRHLTLGIPSGENAHRLLDVAPELAETVIRAHIANKQKDLVEANERARIELDLASE